MHKQRCAHTSTATKLHKTVFYHCMSKKIRDSRGTGITLTGSGPHFRMLANAQFRVEEKSKVPAKAECQGRKR